jgi:hypothetical protein
MLGEKPPAKLIAALPSLVQRPFIKKKSYKKEREIERDRGISWSPVRLWFRQNHKREWETIPPEPQAKKELTPSSPKTTS